MKTRFYKSAWYRCNGGTSKFRDDKMLVCKCVHLKARLYLVARNIKDFFF